MHQCQIDFSASRHLHYFLYHQESHDPNDLYFYFQENELIDGIKWQYWASFTNE